jgi:FeS assembly protein SufD
MNKLSSIGLDFKRIPLPEAVFIEPKNQSQAKLVKGEIKNILHASKEDVLKSTFRKSLGLEYMDYVLLNHNSKIDFHLTQKVNPPIWYSFDDNELIENNHIVIEPYCSGTIILSYEGNKSVHHGLTRVHVKEGASLTLIKFQNNDLSSQYIDQNQIEVEDRGKLKVIDVQLGSENIVVNYDTNLKGYQSDCDYKSIYFGSEKRGFDLSFTANHIGKKSTSDILGKGVLTDKARKVFRGTLNFEQGSAQSVGKEEEIVLLLSDTVKSDSIPALMCSEDDVIGEHGASIGQIDENQLFYLMSRGLSETQSKLLVIASSFREILEAIDDEDLRAHSIEMVDRSIKDVI